jgi:U4/U6.U5 tri-snRNP-associated protein 2
MRAMDPFTANGIRKRKAETSEQSCPYLDTVQRSLLDFDFEPSCSVSLESGPHVYGCLVCGKFFRGRGRQTAAYTHSVDEGHFVFVHLSKSTFHCLPDDYEIKDSSLADISAALHPTFTAEEIQNIDTNTGLARDLFGRRYLPGFVGLNNLHKTDYVNATVQALAHVRPLRDFFLNMSHNDIFIPSKSKKQKPPHRMSHLAQCFGELVRKMWSDKRFKSHVDPHMLIQAITVVSKKRFRVGSQAEAGEFMSWLLNQLHVGLGGTKKPGSSIIYEAFQGRVQVTTRQRKVAGGATEKEKSRNVEANEDELDDEMKDASEATPAFVAAPESLIDETTVDTTFLQLTLDIVEKPLFRDDDGGLVIPQEPLVGVLKKFDGLTFSDALSRSGLAQRKQYRLLKLPKYLILHLARFKTNRYSREKNPTIVAFPVKNLDLGSYVFPEKGKETLPTEQQVRAMEVSWEHTDDTTPCFLVKKPFFGL